MAWKGRIQKIWDAVVGNAPSDAAKDCTPMRAQLQQKNSVAVAGGIARFQLAVVDSVGTVRVFDKNQTLLQFPNPCHTQAELVYRAVLDLECTGNAYIFVAGNDEELFNLPAASMRVTADQVCFISSYLFERANCKQAFTPDEIIHIKYPSADSVYYGSAPAYPSMATDGAVSPEVLLPKMRLIEQALSMRLTPKGDPATQHFVRFLLPKGWGTQPRYSSVHVE